MSELLNFLIEKNVELTLDRTNSTELELLAYDTIKELRHELKKLREERDKLVECVKFYANKENWLYSKESHIGGLIVVKDTWTDQPNAGAACFYPEYGGKLARQTLKYIGEEV